LTHLVSRTKKTKRRKRQDARTKEQGRASAAKNAVPGMPEGTTLSKRVLCCGPQWYRNRKEQAHNGFRKGSLERSKGRKETQGSNPGGSSGSRDKKSRKKGAAVPIGGSSTRGKYHNGP